MQAERHLNDAELGELLAGGRLQEASRHLVACRQCSAEMAELAGLRDALKGDLARAADRPQHFWMRQRARFRDDLVARPGRLRWPIAAMAALAMLSIALLSVKSPPPAPSTQAQTADPDDLLLKDIQHSLAHHAPETLMPASVLVQEMTTNSNHQEKRDN